MLKFEGKFGAHVLDKLEHETVIWLTTVKQDGSPEPNPVWFYWDGKTVLIYSQPASFKLRNIPVHPKVSLHFEGGGDDVVVLTGEATLDPHPPMSEEYAKKYMADIKGLGDTVDQFHADYSIAIHITLTKYRGF